MRHEPLTGLFAEFPLNGNITQDRVKRLKYTAGAGWTNTRADSGRANVRDADQTGRGSMRCRICMSKRFIVLGWKTE